MRLMLLAALAVSILAPASSWAAPTASVRKPVVSVDDIRDLANTGQSAVLKQMIETAVINTGKFRVMERSEQGTSVLLGEQQRAKSGLVTSNTPGKIGGFEGVDFKVYGTITTAGAGTTRDPGRSTAIRAGGRLLQAFGGTLGGVAGEAAVSNSNCNQSSASIAVDIRITDASTGEVRYAKQVTQTDQGETVCGSRSQVDISGLMRAAARRISVGLVTTIYPVKVVDVGDDGQILLNYGEGLLTQGEVYAIFQQGKEIVDPDNGAVLGHKEFLLGLVRITEVTPKLSKANPVSAFSAPPVVGSIAREATPEQMSMIRPEKRR